MCNFVIVQHLYAPGYPENHVDSLLDFQLVSLLLIQYVA